MERKRDPSDITRLINCLSVFEKYTALLFKNLADKVDLLLVKSFLLEISIDSQKHSVLLKGVSESMPKVDWNVKECPRKIGDAWSIIETCTKEIASMKKIDETVLSALLENLATLEGAAGEEYNVFVQLRTLELMADEIKLLYGVNMENLKGIFTKIIEDEEPHIEILATIKEILHRRKQETLTKDPLSKYRELLK